ncbi:MAG: hypothetical protein CMJ80_09305 [Planctomycetaceae bacterium]|nr:hypothetical protein [Planctomycetaceae bacterium]
MFRSTSFCIRWFFNAQTSGWIFAETEGGDDLCHDCSCHGEDRIQEIVTFPASTDRSVGRFGFW